MKFPDGTFYGGRQWTHDDEFFFLFLNLNVVSKNSTPGNFTYIWLLNRAEIIATTFEKTQFVLIVMFLLPSSSSLLKLPDVFSVGNGPFAVNYWLLDKNEVMMTSVSYFDTLSLVVIRGHSWFAFQTALFLLTENTKTQEKFHFQETFLALSRLRYQFKSIDSSGGVCVSNAYLRLWLKRDNGRENLCFRRQHKPEDGLTRTTL